MNQTATDRLSCLVADLPRDLADAILDAHRAAVASVGQAAFKSFECASDAAAFMTTIGQERVVTVHDLSTGPFHRFMVWYWSEVAREQGEQEEDQ